MIIVDNLGGYYFLAIGESHKLIIKRDFCDSYLYTPFYVAYSG